MWENSTNFVNYFGEKIANFSISKNLKEKPWSGPARMCQATINSKPNNIQELDGSSSLRVVAERFNHNLIDNNFRAIPLCQNC